VIRRAPVLLAALGFFAMAEDRTRQYDAEVPKTILELQQFRQSSSIKIRSRAGAEGEATLVNLNPTINAWYVLQVDWNNGKAQTAWHLENPKPAEARLLLDPKFATGLVIEQGPNRYTCELFGVGSPGPLEQARNSQLAYAPLCEGRLYLRNPARGHRTALEAATEFLRDQLWGGEKVVAVFHHLMADRYQETGELESQNPAVRAENGVGSAELPLGGAVDPQYANRQLTPSNLGIALDPDGGDHKMTPGAWYPAAANPGIYVSVIQPNFIAPAILQSYRSVVSNLDSVEARSLCYLIAFDLSRFDLGYALGTAHPEVNWSDRVTGAMKNPALPGPDGIGNISPLVSTGLVRPDNRKRTVAAFTAGFKRAHGAFRSGELALRNHGSHYGFIENGVVFSKLQPGLATVFALDDGTVDLNTWTEQDNRLLARIRYARQNGVPLVEFDEASRSSVPGKLVAHWGPGNWSGSEDEKLRTIRAGLAIQKSNGRRFLIYAVFSDATPSAMARVFQAYQCQYAMLLDMNALEHTYLAVYRRSGAELSVDHLLKGMSELDQSASHENVPRFLGFSDNRDFFYLMRRGSKEAKP
jgi:hypothetical protein